MKSEEQEGRNVVEFDDGVLGGMRRREFLALSGSLITAMSVGGALGAGAAHAADAGFPEGSCGDKAGKRVLVAYASKYGSTGGVADAIGKELCGKGMAVDVAQIKNARNVGSYQGVVIGSAIYMGDLMPEAVDFIQENRDVLRTVPVAYFLVCLTMHRPTKENKAVVLSYMDPVLKAVPEIKPVGIGTFAGALHYSNLSLLMKVIMKAKGSPEGDFRDWNAIRAWAAESAYAKLVR
jgi:menaquinone-dependent protoporphyrinogen oxidase